MDNRDAGESEPETAYYGLGDMARDSIALLDGLDIDRAHVLGHSLGGAIALQLALDHPTRVDHLVLVSPGMGGEPGHRSGDPMPPPPEWWVDDPVARMRLWLPDILGPDYRARMNDADALAIVALERGSRSTWEGMMRQDAAMEGSDQILSRLGEIHTPTLVLHGDADFPEGAQTLAAGIPGARLVMLPAVGHLPWVERPEATTGAILSFLLGAGEPAPAG
jgi:pimeloyl-ACP methyl ester carboxylesterase